MNFSISHTIEPQDDGQSVYFILRRRMGVSEAIVRNARRTDAGVMLDNLPSRTDAVVKSGQTVSLSLFSNGRTSKIEPEAGPLSILFENRDILIIDKQPGIVVHPSRGHFEGTLCNFVAHHLRSSCNDGSIEPSPHPVNRLDKDTSGLIVFAKHAHAQNILQAQLHTNEFKRTYLAICEGLPNPAEGTINAPIARLRDEYGSFGVSETGKYAVTHYRVLETHATEEPLSVVELNLETGRTHQIRVHMSHIGHPLLGDDAYGRPSPLIARCALHSWRIAMNHPVTKAKMHFEAPIPADMRCIANAGATQ